TRSSMSCTARASRARARSSSSACSTACSRSRAPGTSTTATAWGRARTTAASSSRRTPRLRARSKTRSARRRASRRRPRRLPPSRRPRTRRSSSSPRASAAAPPQPSPGGGLDGKAGKDGPDTPAELKARALRYLVRREHSRAELARKLAPHAESPAAGEEGLEAVLARKQLSDERFAEERARVLGRKYGPARIRQDLKAKGVADEISERLASLPDEAERARAILARKYREPAA